MVSLFAPAVDRPLLWAGRHHSRVAPV